mmetsp:Transcript_3298/g.7118  ORF Transcript_3298/g.7118 Transcript_3298/m.7118 type:complete len:339 (-) Transcript_3298:307-1323(-)
MQKHKHKHKHKHRLVPVPVHWYIPLFLFLIVTLDAILSFRVARPVCARRPLVFPTATTSSPDTETQSRLFGTSGGNDDDNNDNTMASESNSNPLSRLGLPEPLLLGSASFTRKLILKEMGVPYSKFVRPIDEKALGDRSEDAPPRELVLLLANAKMDRLVEELTTTTTPLTQPPLPPAGSGSKSKHGGWVVLTGDQVVTCGGKILEKPESVAEAKEFVKGYAISPPSTVGSVVLYHHPSGVRVSGVDTATIHFDQESLGGDAPSVLVDELIGLGEPITSCAGGLMIEHPLTKKHVARIDGTEDSVMGLSKDLVLRLLGELAERLPPKEEEEEPKEEDP